MASDALKCTALSNIIIFTLVKNLNSTYYRLSKGTTRCYSETNDRLSQSVLYWFSSEMSPTCTQHRLYTQANN